VRHSNLFNLLWVVRDKRRHRELIQLEVDVLESRNKRFRHHGAADRFNDETVAGQAATDLWQRSSLQLGESCHAADCLYVDVLQANQYRAGSKVLTLKEEELARTATSWEFQNRGSALMTCLQRWSRSENRWRTTELYLVIKATCSWLFPKQSTRMDSAITIPEDMNCWPIRWQVSSAGICSHHTL
jgi:hypothetical protein